MIRIHLCCALACEARPLIAGWKLERSGKAALYPLYRSMNDNMSLTVTGVGKSNAAAAVAATAEHL